jgi:Notch-like protein
MKSLACRRGAFVARVSFCASVLALGCASGVQDGGSGSLGFGGPGPSSAGADDGADDGSGDDGSGDGSDGDGDGSGGASDGSGGMVPMGSCEVGESEDCYSGPAGTADVGACASGTASCEDGMWGACTGEVLPGAESCNGVDDDCNGTVDDGVDGGGMCSTGMPGACADGTMSCSGGVAACNPVVGPSAEACDNVDNDCNGQTDEGNPGGGGACTTGLQGICSAGTNACSGGAIVCQQNQQAGAEACGDGQDNDCNGQTDEGCSTCSHDICVQGSALVPGCEPCVSQICAVDAFCCSNSWDSVCVNQVASVCGLVC